MDGGDVGGGVGGGDVVGGDVGGGVGGGQGRPLMHIVTPIPCPVDTVSEPYFLLCKLDRSER